MKEHWETARKVFIYPLSCFSRLQAGNPDGGVQLKSTSLPFPARTKVKDVHWKFSVLESNICVSSF